MYPEFICALPTDAHLSGFLLFENKSAKENSNILKKGTQTACEVGENAKSWLLLLQLP